MDRVEKMKNKAKKVILIILLLIIITSVVFVLINTGVEYDQETTENREILDNDYVEMIEVPDNAIEISERLFITHVEHIEQNKNNLLGRTIILDGVLINFENSFIGEEVYAVGRRTPGCCHPEGFAGFIILYDGDLPPEESWVSVVGTVELLNTFPDQYDAVLRVRQIRVMPERGEEWVTR